MVRFGPAGQDEEFAALKKTTLDIPAYLAEKGLSAFEYQCGHGVRISEKSAHAFGEKAKEYGITLSVHAPYYISLASPDEEKRLNSTGYILQAARAADWMGGGRIVVHPGSAGKEGREKALELASDTVLRSLERLESEGCGHISICLETMGKIGQLGTLDEILTLCALDERLVACIDFGHLYARSIGEVQGYQKLAEVLDKLCEKLGEERAKVFHAHFSKIEYTQNGGERRHTTLDDDRFGPDFEPLALLLRERGWSPTIICESAGTQARDAAAMKNIYDAVTLGG